VHYFGDYELLGELAHGGMGVVYRAPQVSLKRVVALKMILTGKFANEAEVQRFRVEAEAAANLQHPNIVAIHEIGEHEGQQYFSMDYVQGPNLAAVIQGKPLAIRRAAELAKAMAEAIHYAHQRGVLHRDLKPQNVLVDERDQPRITDFGLAKQKENESGLTQTGAVMGTPSYMPPEQAVGRQDLIGPQSDIYSLGAVLYEMLTGRPPFKAENSVATLRQVVDAPPMRSTKLNEEVPLDIETICLKCLEKEGPARYATARALAEDLDRFLRQQPILARPIMSAVVCGFGVWLLFMTIAAVVWEGDLSGKSLPIIMALISTWVGGAYFWQVTREQTSLSYGLRLEHNQKKPESPRWPMSTRLAIVLFPGIIALMLVAYFAQPAGLKETLTQWAVGWIYISAFAFSFKARTKEPRNHNMNTSVKVWFQGIIPFSVKFISLQGQFFHRLR